MINQNAIMNAPASHKMSLNSPSHRAQKAPHRHTHSHVRKQKQFCAFTFVSSGFILSIANGLRKESSAFPPTLQQLYTDLHHWKSDTCRIKPIFLISTAMQSVQPQKPASSFRTILSHVASCRGRFQSRARLGTYT